ncbi:hypothetical protein T440DRAFT_493495 [Plenodomus tracheiphilus IPT5]|uniref:Uncharacterized protein n=1 Tax=Plenodomus tracheiphilus IPT5 TaxID=1408161 RepID=A0A6A7ATF4_9PLEO|nr:hypothetical protein T440DRAFT_493495 [Plenodomus tracheiphilus IPT5]
MFQSINVFSIGKLTLDGTSGVARLLGALAALFAEGKPRLQELRVVNQAAQTGHGKLYIHCRDCGRIDVDGIVNHGETLTDLLIVNGSIHRENDTKIHNHRPGHAEPSEFEEALEAIASMQSLKVLRVTNPSNYRKSYRSPGNLFAYFRRQLENGEQRFVFQARADGLMHYLGAHGSAIKVLALVPMNKLTKATSSDKNAHSWPNYYYGHGDMGSATDNFGTKTATARPLMKWE